MPLTRQHIGEECTIRKRHSDEGTAIRKEDIRKFLADYEWMIEQEQFSAGREES